MVECGLYRAYFIGPDGHIFTSSIELTFGARMTTGPNSGQNCSPPDCRVEL